MKKKGLGSKPIEISDWLFWLIWCILMTLFVLIVKWFIGIFA